MPSGAIMTYHIHIAGDVPELIAWTRAGVICGRPEGGMMISWFGGLEPGC